MAELSIDELWLQEVYLVCYEQGKISLNVFFRFLLRTQNLRKMVWRKIPPFVKYVVEVTEKIACFFVMDVMQGKESLPLKIIFDCYICQMLLEIGYH